MRRGLFAHLARNSLWGGFGLGVARLANLACMILLARHLGPEGFGQFALLQGAMGSLGVFAGAGLGLIATRTLAAHLPHERAACGAVLGMVWGRMVIGAAGIGLGIALLGPRASQMLSGPVSATGATLGQGIFLVAGCWFFLQCLRNLQEAVLAGIEDFRTAACLRVLEGAVLLAILPPLVRAFGLWGAVMAMVVPMAVTFAAGQLRLVHRLRALGIKTLWRGVAHRPAVLRQIGLPAFLANLMGTPVLWLGLWYLSLGGQGLTGSAHFAAAYQWVGPVIFLPMVALSVVMPVLTRAWAQGDMALFKVLLQKSLLFAPLMCGALAAAAIFWDAHLMRGFGAGFEPARGVLFWLMLAAPLHVAANIAAVALNAIGRDWWVCATAGAWAVIFAPLAYLGVGALGAMGLALAYGAAYGLQALLRLGLLGWALRQRPARAAFAPGFAP